MKLVLLPPQVRPLLQKYNVLYCNVVFFVVNLELLVYILDSTLNHKIESNMALSFIIFDIDNELHYCFIKFWD